MLASETFFIKNSGNNTGNLKATAILIMWCTSQEVRHFMDTELFHP